MLIASLSFYLQAAFFQEIFVGLFGAKKAVADEIEAVHLSLLLTANKFAAYQVHLLIAHSYLQLVMVLHTFRVQMIMM